MWRRLAFTNTNAICRSNTFAIAAVTSGLTLGAYQSQKYNANNFSATAEKLSMKSLVGFVQSVKSTFGYIEVASKDYEVPKILSDKQFDYNLINYASIGLSGSGKSSFNNALIEDEFKSATGATECTKNAHKFASTDIKDMFFWDLPGYGTSSVNDETYIDDFGLRLFRGIFLITSTRFRKQDKDFFNNMRNELKSLVAKYEKKKNSNDVKHVPVYVVRTKFDQDLDCELKKMLRYKNKMRQYSPLRYLFGKSNKLDAADFDDAWRKLMVELRAEAHREFNEVLKRIDDIQTYIFILSSDLGNICVTKRPNNMPKVRLSDPSEQKKWDEYGEWDDGWLRLKRSVVNDQNQIRSRSFLSYYESNGRNDTKIYKTEQNRERLYK
eukprot:442825_1